MTHQNYNLARALLDLANGDRLEHFARGMVSRMLDRGWARMHQATINITPKGKAALDGLCVAGRAERRIAKRKLSTGVI